MNKKQVVTLTEWEDNGRRWWQYLVEYEASNCGGSVANTYEEATRMARETSLDAEKPGRVW